MSEFNPEKLRDSFREMNEKLDETIELIEEIREDLTPHGQPVDIERISAKLDRLKELIPILEKAKHEIAKRFPPVYGKPFYELYRQFIFLDNLLDLASSVKSDREFLVNILRIAKKEKKHLETFLPEQHVDPEVTNTLQQMNYVLKSTIENVAAGNVDLSEEEMDTVKGIMDNVHRLKENVINILDWSFGEKLGENVRFHYWYGGFCSMNKFLGCVPMTIEMLEAGLKTLEDGADDLSLGVLARHTGIIEMLVSKVKKMKGEDMEPLLSMFKK